MKFDVDDSLWKTIKASITEAHNYYEALDRLFDIIAVKPKPLKAQLGHFYTDFIKQVIFFYFFLLLKLFFQMF